ncbi:MAG: response regulator [Desulfobacteraceae bacterium]|nr:response regulator [Desulfobacteraceae bacterium]
MPKKQKEPKDTILVVEDDPLSLKFISHVLIDAGFETDSAADGQQCLKMVLGKKPHLILMDINMPAMNGIETCRRLKLDQNTRDIPVIFVTGNIDDETLEAAFGAGATDYVRKPVSRVELLARVRSSLNQQNAIKKLAEDEKLKGVLETAGGICHELNQPLQYVLGAIQILMMDVSSEEPIYHSLDSIRASIEKMGQITRKLTAITYHRTRTYAGGLDILDIDRSTEKP